MRVHGLRAIINTTLRAPSGTALSRSTVIDWLYSAPRYLRGLSLARIGLVLLICAVFTARQMSQCLFQIGCGFADGRTLSVNLLFLVRVFLFALPMLVAVTV